MNKTLSYNKTKIFKKILQSNTEFLKSSIERPIT